MYLATYQPFAVNGDESPMDTLLNAPREHEGYFGFKPVWCIPMTSPSEFLAHSMFSAPNLPMLLFIINTEDYVRIDKIGHYRRLEEEDSSVDGLECLDEDRHCEFIVDVKLLEQSLIVPLMQDYSNFMILPEAGKPFPPNVRAYMGKAAAPFEGLSQNVANEEELLDHFDGDTEMYNVRMTGEILKKKFEMCALASVWNMIVENRTNWLYTDAVSKDYRRHIQIANEFVDWSKNDLTVEGYDHVFDKAMSLVIEDPDVIYRLKNANPERNDPCPCGSGKKYKKCHGREPHCFDLKI